MLNAADTNGIVTFASALILLAAPMCSAIDVGVKRSSFDISWSQCLLILEHYKEQVQAARRAIVALQELKSRMNHSRSEGMSDLSFLRDPLSLAITPTNLDHLIDVGTAAGMSLPTTHESFDSGAVDLVGLDPLSIDSILGTWLNQDVGWLEF